MLARLPAVLLRLEGAAVFGASIALYFHADFSVLALILLFLAPDLSLLGYLAGPRTGAAIYNAVHTELWPIVIAALGVLADAPVLSQVGLIWLAHIGIDRVLGYGLKYPTAFQGQSPGSRLAALPSRSSVSQARTTGSRAEEVRTRAGISLLGFVRSRRLRKA